MRKVRYLLFDEFNEWNVVDVDSPESIQKLGVSIDAHAEETAAALKEIVGTQQKTEIFLALSAESCLVAEIEFPQQRRRRSMPEMLYALEAQLPTSGEDLVADFLGGQSRFLGIAVDFGWLEALPPALERQGLPVHGVSPMALLALQTFPASPSESDFNAILWQHNQSIEAFLFEGAQLREWTHINASDVAIDRQLAYWKYQHGTSVSVTPRDVTADLQELARSQADHNLQETEQLPYIESACLTVDRVLRGKADPWIDLCRGPLASKQKIYSWSRPLQFAITGMLMLLATWAVIMYQGQAEYRAIVQQADQNLRDLFEETMPDQPMPVGVRARLKSELLKLAGATGDDSIPQVDSVPPVLANLLRSLPKDIRYRLVDIRITEGRRVVLSGEVRSHGDVDSIAAHLRRGGFRVDQPQSQAMSRGGVSFSLDAVDDDVNKNEQQR